jgi:hypothetical protein
MGLQSNVYYMAKVQPFIALISAKVRTLYVLISETNFQETLVLEVPNHKYTSVFLGRTLSWAVGCPVQFYSVNFFKLMVGVNLTYA